MGHVRDRWTDPVEGSRRRVKNDRYGHGKRWQARWSEDDGRERVLACTTKDEAEAILLHAAVGDIRPRPLEVLRFGEYADRWRRERLHHRASTAEKVESTFRLYLLPALGSLPITSVSRAHVQAAVVGWSEQMSPATVRLIYGYTRSVFKTAIQDSLVEAPGPCVRINLPEVVSHRVVPLTPDQVRTIAAAVPPWYRSLVLLGAATGMRQGELCGLTEDRIANGELKIDRQLVGSVQPDGKVRADRVALDPVFGPPKSKNGYRTLALGAAASAAIAEHRDKYPLGPKGLVFTNQRGGPIVRQDMGRTWRDATEDMPMMRTRSGWHDLRHFNASLLIANGLSVRAVADRLGDRPEEILRTYAHLWPTDQERATAAIDDALQGPTA